MKEYLSKKDEEESTDHILLHFPKAIMLWHLIIVLFDVSRMPSLVSVVSLLGRKEGRLEK